ncbi:hypothetical protein AB1Y20_008187 [Prymnesium parvum]|uniref:peptidylprolyl isomerase n=1 Tax=Prymnesium parvum TaxID=97485 RepID=A0AB34ITH6_PRYPA
MLLLLCHPSALISRGPTLPPGTTPHLLTRSLHGGEPCQRISRAALSPTMLEAQSLSRRSAAALAALSAAGATLPAVATEYDGTWTKHEGPFDSAFFKDFTTTPTGFMYKKINSPDDEKPVPFQKVFVHYTGYLMDGTKFDSSYGREPFSFRLGKGKVINGWEATVGGMTVGQKVIVKIPPQYAYGDKQTGPIPPNSDLVFYIELLKLGGIKGDKPRLPIG